MKNKLLFRLFIALFVFTILVLTQEILQFAQQETEELKVFHSKQDEELAENIVFERLFKSVNSSKIEADKQEKAGFVSRADSLRTYYQRKASLTYDQSLSLEEISAKFQQDIDDLKDRKEIIDNLLVHQPADDDLLNDLLEIYQTRDRLWLKYRDSIRDILGQSKYRQFRQFLQQDIASKITRTSIPVTIHPRLTFHKLSNAFDLVTVDDYSYTNLDFDRDTETLQGISVTWIQGGGGPGFYFPEFGDNAFCDYEKSYCWNVAVRATLEEPSGTGLPETGESCDGYVEARLYPSYQLESGTYSADGDHAGEIGFGSCSIQDPNFSTSTFDSVDVVLRPRVTINPIEAVGKGTNGYIYVEVTPANNQTPVTLTLRRLQGTGEARFAQNNGSNLTVAQTSTIETKGITESSVKDNYIIEAKLSNRLLASDRFSIAKIKILRTIGNQQPTEVTDTAADTIVGERIKLNAEIIPSGISVSNHSWTIPGSIMKDFAVTQTSSQVVPVASLTNANVDYVWYDGANNRAVDYKANVGGNQISGKTTFNVVRPEASIITLTPSMTAIDYATGQLELHLGANTRNDFGIRFSKGFISIPNPFSGDTQWVQTISRNVTATSTSGQSGNIVDSGLDACYPYGPVNINSVSDSPGYKLNQIMYVSLNSQWTMWLMFKPSGADSSWVTLRKVNWGWSAEARLRLSNWNLIRSTDPNQPTDTNSTEFPIWSVIVPSAGGPCQ